MIKNDPGVVILIWTCFLVPGAVAIAPHPMAQSTVARSAVHIGCAGIGLHGYFCLSGGPLRRFFLAVSLLAMMQYWALVVLERAFEKRYGRAPRIAFMAVRLQSDPFMSFACWGLALAAGFIAVYVSVGFA
jgi:hypothetical protein